MSNALRKRIRNLQAQLNDEREKRTAHLGRVTLTVKEWKGKFQRELDRYAALQAQYDDLLMKYLEVIGDGEGENVSGEGEVRVEEGGPLGPAEALEEGAAGA